MTDWWKRIEDELDARSVDAPDPWAGVFEDDPASLTAEQQRFLVDLSDQPRVPRLSDGFEDEGDALADEDNPAMDDDGSG